MEKVIPKKDGGYQIIVTLSDKELDDRVASQIYEKFEKLLPIYFKSMGLPSEQEESQELFVALKKLKSRSDKISDKIFNMVITAVIAGLIAYLVGGIHK